MNKKSFAIWSLLYRNIVLILAMIIFFAAVSGVYSYAFMKPTYTANKQVIISADLDPEAVKTSAYATNNASLASTLLPTISKQIKTPKIVSAINRNYKQNSVFAIRDGQEISASNIKISFDYKSLIFSVSYIDIEERYAIDKLNCVIKNFNNVFNEFEEMDDKLLSSGKVSVISVQNSPTVKTNKFVVSSLIKGALVGFLCAIIIVLVKFFVNNKITNAEELAEITGQKVMTCIEK